MLESTDYRIAYSRNAEDDHAMTNAQFAAEQLPSLTTIGLNENSHWLI